MHVSQKLDNQRVKLLFSRTKSTQYQFPQSHIIFLFKQQYFRNTDKARKDATSLHYKTASHP